MVEPTFKIHFLYLVTFVRDTGDPSIQGQNRAARHKGPQSEQRGTEIKDRCSDFTEAAYDGLTGSSW